MSLILNKAKAIKNNAVNDNLIINGNFDIWQRGLTFITTGYCADRWFVYENGAIEVSKKSVNDLENSSSCLRIKTLPQESGSSTSSFTLAQAVESEKIIPLRNKYVTLSFYVRSPSDSNWSGNLLVKAMSSTSINSVLERSLISDSSLSIAISNNDSWVKYSKSFLLPTNCTSLTIEFYPSASLSSNSILDIAQVKLEGGNFATIFKSNIDDEKNNTKRFYQKTAAKLKAGTGAASNQRRKFGSSVPLFQSVANPDSYSVSIIENNNIGLSNVIYSLANSNSNILEISADSSSPHSELNVSLVIDSEFKFGNVPKMPSGVSIQRTSSGVYVSWLSGIPYINEPISYTVNYGQSSDQLDSILTTSQTSGFISGIYDYTPFYASVSSSSYFGNSEPSRVFTSAPLFSVPSGVTNLSGVWLRDAFYLSWDHIVDNGGSPLRRYIVQISNNSGFVNQSFYGYDPGSSGYTITQSPTLNYRNISRLKNIEVSGSDPYYARVAGYNLAGTGTWSSTFVLNKTEPTPILNLSTLSINSGIILQYSPPSGNGGVNISILQTQHDSSSSFSSPVTRNYSPNFEPITISGLTNGVGRWFRMRAINSIGSGNWSSYVSGIPNRTLTIPNSPTGLVPSWVDTSGIDLNFKSPSDDGGSPIINYTVNIATNSGFSSNSNTFNTINNNPGIQVPTPLYTGTYYLRVKANNSIGSSSYSTGVSINSTTPAASIVSAAIPLNSGVTLNWLGPIGRGSEVTSYNITRSSSSSFTSSTAITGITGVLTYTATGLTNNSLLYFKVNAINIAGTGLDSNIVSATPKSPVTVPSEPIITSLSRTISPSAILLNWSEPINNGGSPILSYNYEYSTGNLFNSILSSGLVSGSVLYYSLSSGIFVETYSRVRAINAQGTGSWSNVLSVQRVVSAPSIPLNFSGLPSSGSFSLSWAPPASSGNDTSSLTYSISSSKIINNSTQIGPSFSTTGLTGLLDVSVSGASGPGTYNICVVAKNSQYVSSSSCLQLTNTNLQAFPTSFNFYYKTDRNGYATRVTSRIFNDYSLTYLSSETIWKPSAISDAQSFLSKDSNDTSWGIAIYKRTTESYFKIDFGSDVYVSNMYLRPKVFGTVRGSAYIRNKPIFASSDGETWTQITSVGTISSDIKKISINKTCRYIKINNPTNNSWMSLSKLYFD